MTILDKICDNKRNELLELKRRLTLSEIRDREMFGRQCISLKQSLIESKSGIISEFKRCSPSKGDIHADAQPEIVVAGYEQAGASGVSCLADKDFFGGSPDDVVKARNVLTHTPLLYKEFVVDDYQLSLAKSCGADVVLLIAACLERNQLAEYAHCAKELGLETLLEIHSGDELEYINDRIDIVGVNNRNLKVFKTDVQTSFDLAAEIPSDFVKISESGISQPSTVIKLREVGFRGFLMGENFMKEPDPAAALLQFIQELT
ncbi:MAG: indole-3-glycerol phosphate synthase TrpC [Bacteroidales bacterium]|nr:indole-3-glycerol phosphate synthase TrpC [Bacteroidales bacterium]